MLGHESVDAFNLLLGLGEPFHEDDAHVDLFEELVSTRQSFVFSSFNVHLHDELPGLHQGDQVVDADGLHFDRPRLVLRHVELFEVSF